MTIRNMLPCMMERQPRFWQRDGDNRERSTDGLFSADVPSSATRLCSSSKFQPYGAAAVRVRPFAVGRSM